MSEHKKFFSLAFIMIAMCISATIISMFSLYETALDQQRERLVETATSQARLIEAVAVFDRKYSRHYPQGSFEATLSQIRDAHRNYKGFGKTGEFTLARRVGDQIVFLLSHRHYDLNQPKPVEIGSPYAEPMKLALAGKSGTVIGLDYRGKKVLAAYEPVAGLGLGIVAKLDMTEITMPYFRTALSAMGAIFLLIGIGAVLFMKVSLPIIRQLKEHNTVLSRIIREQKKSEKALQKSEDFLKILLEAAPIPVFYKDDAGRYLGFNREFETFFGQSREQLIGKSVFETNPPELAEIYHKKDKALLKKGGTQRYEAKVNTASGDIRDVVFNKAALVNRSGAVIGLIGTITDQTDTRKAETELRRREQLLNEMGSIAKIGGWEHDLVTGKAIWTKEIYKIIGIDESQPIPSPDEHLDYYPPKDRKTLEHAYRQAIDTGKQFDLELQCTTAAGELFWARAIGRPEFRHGKCVKMMGTFQDITEKKKWEERLFQSQKMESVGNLAGGVAHDYNNMLSVIIGYTEFALRSVDRQGRLYEDLNEIYDAAKRSADITGQLLAFARQQTIDPKVIDLNENVAGLLKMLGRLIGEDIDLSWNPGSNVWPVKMDPAQVHQMIANLCVNARDAISDVGKVTIETSNVTFDETYCANHAGFVPGDFVMLAVSDDGCGMTPDVLDKIFDPFFTTKEPGKGTGLGLSTLYGIVKQNNGFINVYSEPEKGTTIKVYLSRHRGKAIAASLDTAAEMPRSQGETILLVEDDRQLLKFGERLLKSLGYNVMPAASPAEAIILAKAHPAQIDLLLTDVVMPEMNGRELSETLQKTVPDLKTLYMSGYTANVIAHRGVLDKGVSFIQKPFSEKDMATMLRKVLNSG